MATKNVSKETGKDLASYWKETVTQFVANEFPASDNCNSRILINLASEEYSTTIDPTLLPSDIKVVKVVFQQEGRVISTHAKRARGLMARYLADVNATTVEHVQGFQLEGYTFVNSKSDDTTLVFNRKKQVKAAPTDTTRQKRTASTDASKDENDLPNSGNKTRSKR